MTLHNPSSAASADTLREWYRIKPYAMSLFNDTSQDRYWIKNAWLLAFNSGACRTGRIADVVEPDRISENERLWILALWELFWGFKSAVDFAPYSYDLEEWCSAIGIEYESRDKDCLLRRISEVQSLFKAALCRVYPDGYDRLAFMTNAVMVPSCDEYLQQYCGLHEEGINGEDDMYALEYERYNEYRNEMAVPGSEECGFAWVQEHL
jgi:hypothetical protein